MTNSFNLFIIFFLCLLNFLDMYLLACTNLSQLMHQNMWIFTFNIIFLNLILFMHQNMCTFIFNIFLFVQITCEFWCTFVIPSFSLLSKSIQLICLQLVMCIDQPISCDLHRTMCILIFKIATLCVVCKYLYFYEITNFSACTFMSRNVCIMMWIFLEMFYVHKVHLCMLNGFTNFIADYETCESCWLHLHLAWKLQNFSYVVVHHATCMLGLICAHRFQWFR